MENSVCKGDQFAPPPPPGRKEARKKVVVDGIEFIEDEPFPASRAAGPSDGKANEVARPISGEADEVAEVWQTSPPVN